MKTPKTGEEKEYSVITRVELKKLFPGKEVWATDSSKLAANHLPSFCDLIVLQSISDQEGNRNELVCKSKKDRYGEETNGVEGREWFKWS